MRVAVLSGILAGCLSEIAFLALHAVVIAPIWWSAAQGLPFVIICGALIGGGLHLVFPPRAYLTIGAFLWGSIALTTLFVQTGRRLSLLPVELTEVILSIAVAIAYGAAIGWRMRGERKAAIGGAVAGIAVLVAAHGPFVQTSRRAIALFFGMLPVTCFYAIAFVAISAMITARFRDSWLLPRRA